MQKINNPFYEQGNGIMKRETKNLCLISTISFFLGVLAGCIFFGLSISGSCQREKDIRSYFYRTMYAIFKDTYDADEGSIYPKPLKTINEYEPQLGKKCELFINDSSPDYTEGIAFFPSGDFFYVLIDRKGKSWVINQFNHLNWEREWGETLYRIGER